MLPETRLTLRQRKKAATKERIYLEALELFRRQGFSAATVEEIAQAANVSKGTFFNYFPSKEALLYCLGQRLALATARELQTVVDDPRPGTRERLAHLLRRLAETVEADRELTRLGVFEALKAPDAGAVTPDPYRQLLRQSIRALLSEGQRRGELAAGLDLEFVGGAFAGMYFQQLFEWCTAEAPYALAPRLDQLVRLMWNGAGSGLPPSAP